MTTFKNGLVTLVVLLALFALFLSSLVLLSSRKLPSFGSVGVGSEYNSTTTPQAGQINGTGGVVMLTPATQTTNGSLASVTITGGPKSGTISLYDATTSNVNLRTGTLATSSIYLMDIPAGAASTTFPCDCVYHTGLLLVTTGSVATSTITFR